MRQMIKDEVADFCCLLIEHVAGAEIRPVRARSHQV
jgi:hypothetical protein